MPWHGPVAYQVQEGFLTWPVISRGSSQLSPSSRLQVSHAVRGASPSTIRFSGPSAKFLQSQDDAAAGGQQRRRGVGAVAAGPVLEQQPPVMHPLDRCHQFSQNPGDVLLPTRATREG